jgi:hypothetical protein
MDVQLFHGLRHGAPLFNCFRLILDIDRFYELRIRENEIFANCLVPGIEIQAQVIETIFEGRFLRRPTWLKWAESGSIMAFGLLIIWSALTVEHRLKTELPSDRLRLCGGCCVDHGPSA